MRQIVILDLDTLGEVPNLHKLSDFGIVNSYPITFPNEIVSRISKAEIIITNKVVIDRDVMKQCPHLKLICVSATGTNNVDLESARQLGIQVRNAVGYSSNSVAQHTIASILQLYNQLSYYDHFVKSGGYYKSKIFTHHGPTIIELHNKNFGIIGLGNIGNTVAKVASGFGARVSYYSTSGKNNQNEYPQLSLKELLQESDVVSIHAPLNDKTKNLISTKALMLMKPTSILVNVGRGGIVNELALANAIEKNQIGGACIDVFENEPINQNNPLLKIKNHEKLVLTPHNAWASIEARTKLIEIVYNHIKDYTSKINQ